MVKFVNDNDTHVDLIDHELSPVFAKRDEHEVYFRRIHSYLIKHGLLANGNIVDLGAWIGDNAIPWAKQIPGTVYAIDPSAHNLDYIRRMAEHNGINNITTIQKVISDKGEIVGTFGDINHCSFRSGATGTTRLAAVTLDDLKLPNIALIHLDVEGFEFKVVRGATETIERCRPIISFEQHVQVDNYLGLSEYLCEKGYDIYLINEVLPGCRRDCRNFMAFPCELNYGMRDIDNINEAIGQPVLLNILKGAPRFVAEIRGTMMSGKLFSNIKSTKIDDNLYVFCIFDRPYTKMIAVDANGEWIHGKYMLGKINIHCDDTIFRAYHTADGIVTDRSQYDVSVQRSTCDST